MALLMKQHHMYHYDAIDHTATLFRSSPRRPRRLSSRSSRDVVRALPSGQPGQGLLRLRARLPRRGQGRPGQRIPQLALLLAGNLSPRPDL